MSTPSEATRWELAAAIAAVVFPEHESARWTMTRVLFNSELPTSDGQQR